MTKGLEAVGCCCSGPSETTAVACPVSGTIGKAVYVDTIKALLSESALARFEPGEYRFCADAACDIVYFSTSGTRFATSDIRVPVWQKLPFGARPVCYCFGESEASIRSEIEAGGRSAVVERVRAHIAANRCACELRNPRGACCLGDVIAAVKRVQSAMSSEGDATTGAKTHGPERHAQHR